MSSRLLGHPLVFDLQQWLTTANLRPVKRWVAEVLRVTSGDWVLDVCCGTGNFAKLARGHYLGIDLDRRAIRRARRKFRRDRSKRFVVADVSTLPVRKKTFRKTLFANGLHHLGDAEAIEALRWVARATRETVVVVDPAPETIRLISRFLLTIDQGRHIRSLTAQLALLQAGGLRVEEQTQIYSGFASQRVFLCQPEE